MKLDLGHVVIVAIGFAFIGGLAWLAYKADSQQLYAIVTLGAGSWLSVVAALLKMSPRDTAAYAAADVASLSGIATVAKDLEEQLARSAPTDPPKKDPPS